MEPPVRTDSESIRDEKVKVLKAIAPIDEKNIVRGHFAATKARRALPAGSQTETFAALKLEINSWRWQGVPSTSGPGKQCRSRAPRFWFGCGVRRMFTSATQL